MNGENSLLVENKKLRQKIEALELMNLIQKQQIVELTPKTTYYDIVLNVPHPVSTLDIAKDYGEIFDSFCKILGENKILLTCCDGWKPNDDCIEKGFAIWDHCFWTGEKNDQQTMSNIYWTQKGRLFIYDTLKSAGILPIIEQKSV